jgi:hypothetical protein
MAERTESQTDEATESDAESQARVNDERVAADADTTNAESQARENDERVAADADSTDGEGGELFSVSVRDELEQKWNDVQARFVDEPRGSVEEANALVSDLMDRLVSSFSAQRDQLEKQWDRGDDVSTEDLRLVLMRYRSFFGRLLEVPGDR